MAEPYTIVRPVGTNIGTVIPDCIVEEVMEDKAQITSHPVEKGADISDHAFMMGEQLEMKIAWADYKGGEGASVGRSGQMYEDLLRLQKKLDPLDVMTSRGRKFKNMLIEGVSLTHDEKTANAAIAIVRMREVRFADSVTTVSVAARRSAIPQTTSPAIDAGPVQPQQSQNSNTSNAQPADSTDFILPQSPPVPTPVIPQPPPAP